MSSQDDISRILKSWPYDPHDSMREIVGDDGQSRLQVRFPMGVEQYELDGRPDGQRPMGQDSYLDYFLRLRDAKKTARGSDEEFRLVAEDCDLLRDEGLIYYYRYDLLYQRKDYARVVRDAARNIALFDFVARYAALPEDRESMEIYRPFTYRLHYASRAQLCLGRKRFDEGLRQIRMGITRLEQMEPLDDPKWRREQRHSIAMLRRLEARIRRNRPLTPRQRLQRELKQAVDREDYEVAAKLRDRLATLGEEEAPVE